jgi:hypothetical protein
MHRVQKFETSNEHQVSVYRTDLHFSPPPQSHFLTQSWTGNVVFDVDDKWIVIEYSEKHPPLILEKGMQSEFCHVQSTVNGKSPFLFQLSSGETQFAIVNECFRAPLFRHETTFDFFLRPSSSSSSSSSIMDVIPISKIYLCGQTEPHIPVPVPDKKRVMRNQEALMVWGILTVMDAKTMTEIRETVLSSYTLENCPSLIRKCNKWIRAIGQQTTEDGRWTRKENLDPCFDSENIRLKLSPAQICAETSSLTAARRLRDLGITENPSLDQISKWLSKMKCLRAFKKKRIVELKLQMQRSNCSADDLWEVFVGDILQLDQRIRIGEFVYTQLSRAPWNTTSTFLATQVECDHKRGLMRVDLGEDHEFTYVRDETLQSSSSAKQDFRHVKKKVAIKLMEDVFDLPATEIDELQTSGKATVNQKLQELSTKSVEHCGSDNNPLARFARNAKIVSPHSFLSKCNAIARRQRDKLTCGDIEGKCSNTVSAIVCQDEREKLLHSIAQDCSTTPQARNDLKDFVYALTTSPTSPPTEAAEQQPQEQVVRRTVRETFADGTERIVVQFLFGENEIKQAWKRQRQNQSKINVRK